MIVDALMNIRLFNRATRSVSLTDAGNIFVERGPAMADRP